MTTNNRPDGPDISRRRLLQGTGGTLGAIGLGTAPAAAHGSDDDDHGSGGSDCPKATARSGMVHYDDSIHEACADDHPSTRAIQANVRASLEAHYPTVGALIDAGYIPYFDFFAEGSWSHWINPAFIAGDWTVDPDRPESILVDHTWWRPIGVMFIATDGADPVDPPPTVYREDGDTDAACTPWHAHTGFPGRYSWWKYRTAYHGNTEFPCRTPWMMHVWIHDHPESVYAHAAPEERGGPPAESPGFTTEADPNEEDLGPEHLPDAIRTRLRGL